MALHSLNIKVPSRTDNNQIKTFHTDKRKDRSYWCVSSDEVHIKKLF